MFHGYQNQPPQPYVRPALSTSATFVEPNCTKPLPNYPQNESSLNSSKNRYYGESDYVNTYIAANAKKHQEKTAYFPSRTPSSGSSVNRDSASTFGRQSSLKSVVNTHQLQYITTSDLKHESTISASTTATTPSTSTLPEYAFMSILSKAFLRRVRGLEHVRELFCANEYPESFTGQEAIVCNIHTV
jgi:hypothetical protein